MEMRQETKEAIKLAKKHQKQMMDWLEHIKAYPRKEYFRKATEYLQCGASPEEAMTEAQFEQDYQKYLQFLDDWSELEEPDSCCGDCDSCNHPCDDLELADNS